MWCFQIHSFQATKKVMHQKINGSWPPGGGGTSPRAPPSGTPLPPPFLPLFSPLHPFLLLWGTWLDKDDKGVLSIYFHIFFLQIPSLKIDRDMYILVIALLCREFHHIAKNVQNTVCIKKNRDSLNIVVSTFLILPKVILKSLIFLYTLMPIM